MLVPLPSLKKLKTAQVLLLLRVILRLLVLNSSYWRWLYEQFFMNPLMYPQKSRKKMQWMYGAAISYATSHATLLPTGEERCVTSDDPNNGCEGD